MKKVFQDMLHELGEVNPTHAYYNGSRTSKDNEDLSWSTSFKTRRTQKTSSALEMLWKTLFFIIVLDRNISQDQTALRWKPYQRDSLNLPDHRYKRRCCSLILAESDLLPHAHAQTTKTYYWHQDSRIKKAQEKTFANSDIQDLRFRYQV
ncbi:hypothetical protein Tco_0134227 [Tanacetum coccineum]